MKIKETNGEIIRLPENPAPYLTDWLFEIGPAGNDGALSWQEMAAWERLTGIELDPWEATTLRRLSIQYLNMKHEAKEPGCPPPWGDDEQRQVDTSFAAMMKALAHRPKEGK